MMSSRITVVQSQAECYLALERGPQARGRAAGKGQLLRRGGPRMALAEAGAATVWRRGLRPSRLAGILGSQCLHVVQNVMEARQVTSIGNIPPMQKKPCLNI